MRVNHANAKFIGLQRNQSAANVSRTKLHKWTVPVKIPSLRLEGINPSDQNAPTCAPVAEPEESSPFAIGIAMEEHAPQSFPAIMDKTNWFHQTLAR
jgi:hypothetical protein